MILEIIGYVWMTVAALIVIGSMEDLLINW